MSEYKNVWYKPFILSDCNGIDLVSCVCVHVCWFINNSMLPIVLWQRTHLILIVVSIGCVSMRERAHLFNSYSTLFNEITTKPEPNGISLVRHMNHKNNNNKIIRINRKIPLVKNRMIQNIECEYQLGC